MFLGSSVVEQSAVNRSVAGSSPARGAIIHLLKFLIKINAHKAQIMGNIYILKVIPKYFAETPTTPGPIINPEKANVIRLAIVVGIFSVVDLIACRITIGLVFPVAKPNKREPRDIK